MEKIKRIPKNIYYDRMIVWDKKTDTKHKFNSLEHCAIFHNLKGNNVTSFYREGKLIYLIEDLTVSVKIDTTEGYTYFDTNICDDKQLVSTEMAKIMIGV